MNTRPFYSPDGTHNPLRFYLPVGEPHCVGPAERRFLMGGVGLAAAIDAMERVTQRPLIWATAQYLSFVQPESVLDLDVRAPVMGKRASQARVVAHVGEREILTTNAALGAQPDQPFAQYLQMADVPKPDDCDTEIAPEGFEHEGLHLHFDQRRIEDPDAAKSGIFRKWLRTTDPLPMSAGLLAIIGDFLLGAVSVTLGQPVSTNSLDNTIRMHTWPETPEAQGQWLLLDTRIAGVASGFCHGEMNIFTPDGVLLATASQSGIVRVV